VVKAKVRNVSTDVNGTFVTLTPLANATTTANATTMMGSGLYGWLCGSTGTTLNTKYLPGSCRGQ